MMIGRKMEESERLLKEENSNLFGENFHLVCHTVPACVQAIEYLNTLVGADGNLIRPLNEDEIKWIRNERAICRVDFLYWATRYAFIKDWTGQMVRFSPNLAQKVIIAVMAEMELAEIAILLQIHKARQEGVTTLAELIMLWRTMFTPGANTLVASSRPGKTPEMAKKMEIAFDRLPYWMCPRIVTRNSEKIGFDDQDSYFHLRHGAMMSDMGRGDTFTTFHLSEVSEYLNPKEAIDAALLHAAHDSPWLLGLLESTGKGRSGWWYDKWQYNIRYWPMRQSRLQPVFLPWYLLREIYPTPAWVRAHPIPKDYIFTERGLKHAAKAEEYVHSGENHIVSRELGKDWRMPKEQIYFWEISRQEAQAGGELHIFYQELCANAEEGFQSPNSGVFDAETITEYRENTPRPWGVYGLRCSQVEVPIHAQANYQDIDPNRPPIDIRCNWNPNGSPYSYQLLPLLHRGSAPFDPHNKIIIYEPPNKEKYYGLGIDTGFGVGKDRSVIEILRKGDAYDCDKQVGEFASDQLNSFNLWPFAFALGTFYSTTAGGQLRQAKQVIEGAANGENVYNELRKRGWRNFHNWVRYDRKKIMESAANRQLWYTTTWSRPLLMDMLLDALSSRAIDITSPWFVEEMADLEVDEEKLKILAALNKHDDRIMALGMVLFSMHALETKYRDHWVIRDRNDNPVPEDFPRYTPGMQGGPPKPTDPGTGNTYRVIRPGDPVADYLRPGGASIWTPNWNQ